MSSSVVGFGGGWGRGLVVVPQQTINGLTVVVHGGSDTVFCVCARDKKVRANTDRKNKEAIYVSRISPLFSLHVPVSNAGAQFITSSSITRTRTLVAASDSLRAHFKEFFVHYTITNASGGKGVPHLAFLLSPYRYCCASLSAASRWYVLSTLPLSHNCSFA